ncbi:aminotransferase class V-fold PLP-dependent enzyme [Nitrosomonas sp.]|uniref:aminotransferase class V-fold PLP-dependent enzyme n=1 Tax=Nitrosomonas sp. TaxID=42353 RepID=UPI001DC3A1A7|nr:aminotransferase class V-fold PLP-dependent enzyme [Nitrosomonas sp.]MBX3616505.1 aminotransferase class V-fold PLP-dependent enzyme [Nitrosomonas sp.]
MTINRRHFLSMTGATALAAVCSPYALATSAQINQPPQKVSAKMETIQSLARQKEHFLGYPINMNTLPKEFFAWRNELATAGFNQFAFNNVGNPYEHSHIPFNSHSFERELIDRFGALYGFPDGNTWGFLSNSGTDSNMHGLYMGRTILHSRTGVPPKIYFTKEAHYSIQILRDVLQLESVIVDTKPDGAMDTDDLERQLNIHRDRPALVVATIGTTFKGAIDPIDTIQERLKNRNAYLHLDAALFGGFLPHTPFAAELMQQTVNPLTGNTSERYDSIAVSCHKFFGFPSPAGLFITTRKNFTSFLTPFSKIHDPEYIQQVPGTITCSRDAVKPAEFYFFSSEKALAQQAADAKDILDNTAYLLKEMNNHYSHLRPVRINDHSNIVYFIAPDKTVIDRYSLATMRLSLDGKLTPCAHVVIMPHVTKEILDRFLADLRIA